MRFELLVAGAFLAISIVGAPGIGRSENAIADAQSAGPGPGSAPRSERPRYVTVSVRGRVVWMSEALQRRFGVHEVPEAKQQLLALETACGKLLPIIEDARGRSLRIDERLRAMDLELRVRQYSGSPMIQVIHIYEWKKGKKYSVDYWCDVCAIAMFQKGPCSCCQAPNRLRERPASELQP